MHKEKEEIIVIHNVKTDEYFFSTDHIQPTDSLGDSWVPVTYYIPQYVQPRPSLPSGWINTKEDLIAIFLSNKKEIPNPNPKYRI